VLLHPRDDFSRERLAKHVVGVRLALACAVARPEGELVAREKRRLPRWRRNEGRVVAQFDSLELEHQIGYRDAVTSQVVDPVDQVSLEARAQHRGCPDVPPTRVACRPDVAGQLLDGRAHLPPLGDERTY
jgi:hypothetical protein